MTRIIYAKRDLIPDLSSLSSVEIAFSDPIGRCRELREGVSARGGMEALKRIISSASFSVIVLSSFSAIADSVKDSVAFWVSDHLSEPEAPLLIVESSGPWKEGVVCSDMDDVQNYLVNIK